METQTISFQITYTFITALFILIAGEIGYLLGAKIEELHTANEEIRSLQWILSICANCKKIRDDNGFWNQVETYFSTHSDLEFTHGLCGDCSDEMREEILSYKKGE